MQPWVTAGGGTPVGEEIFDPGGGGGGDLRVVQFGGVGIMVLNTEL